MIAEITLTVAHPQGLHARPASLLVEKAQGFSSSITVKLGEVEADGKSILSVLTLGAEQGSSVTIRASGVDADKAIEALRMIIEQGFSGNEQIEIDEED
jgi:phosphotransferase system HPr (HPr) family protein